MNPPTHAPIASVRNPVRTPPRKLDPRTIAEAAERLSAPSAVVASVLELVGGDAPARMIANRLAQSPEISAHVLRLANSAFYGGPVDTLPKAVVRIGDRHLRSLLMAASTYRLLEQDLPLYGLPRLALLRHSTSVASAAQSIAERLDPTRSSKAFVAGLIHDLGKAILAEATRGMDVPTITSLRQERSMFATDHARVATWVAKRWGLPSEICEAIQFHHDSVVPDGVLQRVVWLANILVHAELGEADALEKLPGAAEACGVALGDMEGILSQGVGERAEASDLDAAREVSLTDRELQVLRALAGGSPAKGVAVELGCSVSTVHNHLHNVYRKLEVRNQGQALLRAREIGLI